MEFISTIDDFIANFVDALDFDTLLTWADITRVEHNETEWFDDEWPDREAELRDNVVEALMNFGKEKRCQKKTILPT